MALPESIRVKLSSEAAGAIALTPVVVREMAFRDLLDVMLAATGKDTARIADLLRRGTFVSGASRFRWAGLDASTGDLAGILQTFPDPDPARAFDPSRCTIAVLRGALSRVEVTRETGTKVRWFRRRSFWEALLDEAVQPTYSTYSYKDHADVYRLDLTLDAQERLRAASDRLAYTTLTSQIRRTVLDVLELHTTR